MEKNIYLEVSDAIESYIDSKDYELFNALHEKINVFDKRVIEGDLRTKINEVLNDFYQLPSFNIETPLFDNHSNIDFISHFSEYLEYRYDNDKVFSQGFRYIESDDYEGVKEFSIKDFIPLENRFFDSQRFYLNGMLDPSLLYETYKSGPNENLFQLNGIKGGKLNLFLSDVSKTDLISLHRSEIKLECIIYGKVTFDPNLRGNIISSKHIYIV